MGVGKTDFGDDIVRSDLVGAEYGASGFGSIRSCRPRVEILAAVGIQFDGRGGTGRADKL